jgi:PBSX family phage portal protein
VAFTFGEPEQVPRARMLDYVEAMFNGRWYEPPLPFDGLARAFRASPHHSSSIYLKRNLLVSLFQPHALLSRGTFGAWVLDFLTFGNGYLEAPRSVMGSTMELRRSLALYTRRGRAEGQFFFVPNWEQEHEFAAGTVFQLQEDDLTQEVYGLPEYLSALHSAWLNEAATMFRRHYYENGSHAGFILYLSDAQVSNTDVDKLRDALKQSKGPGNFRNLFLHAPAGKADGLKLIPVSEVAAKDDFTAIKNASRDDVLAAHRVPPGLLGIIPNNTGGFGAAADATRVFFQNEIAPLQQRLSALNDWLGEEVVRFAPFEPPTKA